MEFEQMRANYDFDYSKAVRGKYYKRILKEGSNVVVLEPDIAKACAKVGDSRATDARTGGSGRLTEIPGRSVILHAAKGVRQ